jgi:hypothetical protein
LRLVENLAFFGPPHRGTRTMSTDHFDALADAPMFESRPTAEASAALKDELIFQRATQTYLWALPLINTLGMKLGSEKVFGAGYNVLPVWKDRLDAKTLVTTPNSDVIYAMSYVDLGKNGPLVFEAPPGLQGILLDFGSARSPARRSTDTPISATSGSPAPTPARGASSCCFRRATQTQFPTGFMFIARAPTTCSCFCARFIRTRKT